ncbi:MAG: response regulator [Desulfobacterales bacterium]
MKGAEGEDRRILLVDDEPGIRRVLSLTLADAGWEVLCAENGEEALALFREKKPPIVLTDIKMPEMDGIELLRHIKAESPDTEVIMFTGHGDMELAIQSLKHEATDFVTKPIHDEVLEIALKRARERIALRRRLREYTENLERLVEEKARRLIEAERLAAVGQTAAELAHTIKNIANALGGSLFVLGKGIELEERETLRQGWGMVQRNVERIKTLALDLLHFGRYAVVQPAPGDPNAPAEEAARLLEERLQNEGIAFSLETLPEPRPVAIDAGAIQRALVNLLTNAAEAFRDLPENDPRERRVALRVRPLPEGGVLYEVEDNGCGMEEEVRGRLFQGFFTTKGTAGSGIGLLLTRRIVEGHGGTIAIESRPGEGTRVRLLLPAGVGAPR